MSKKDFEEYRELPERIRKRIAAELILIETKGAWTNTRIADLIGVDQGTVGRWRKNLPEGLLPDEVVRVGADGRMTYPRRERKDENITILSKNEAVLLQPLENMLAIYEETPPAIDRPEVRMFIDNPHWKKRTKKAKRVGLNKIARLLGYKGYEDPAMPWWKLTKKEHVLAIYELLKQDSTIKRAFNVYLCVLKDIFRAQWSIDSNRVSSDELRKVELIKPPRQTQPKKQARIPEVSEWIQIAKGYDLDKPSHWMRLAQLVLAFPCGLRPIDIAGVLDKSYLHLDDGYIRLWREKTETSGGVAMVDCYPGVQMVLKKWISMIPKNVDQIWFKQARNTKNMMWDKPFLPIDSHIISDRIIQFAERYGVKNFSAYCGRRSYRTFATLAGVEEWIIKINGGWQQKGASWDYFETKIDDMRGAFKKVPEFIEFDNALIEIVFPYLNGRQRSLSDLQTVVEERRVCSECGKLLPEGSRSDKLTCDAKCRQRRKMRVDTHT